MEILAEKTVEVMGYPPVIAIAVISSAIICLIAYIINMYCSNCKICNICFIITIGLCILIIGAILFGRSPQEQYQEYKVAFNEKIDMNEFAKNYELLYQEDNIFTIKDKENTPIIKE